jgi:hypothetical protein
MKPRLRRETPAEERRNDGKEGDTDNVSLAKTSGYL